MKQLQYKLSISSAFLHNSTDDSQHLLLNWENFEGKVKLQKSYQMTKHELNSVHLVGMMPTFFATSW